MTSYLPSKVEINLQICEIKHGKDYNNGIVCLEMTYMS
jgi:hypothetical protein